MAVRHPGRSGHGAGAGAVDPSAQRLPLDLRVWTAANSEGVQVNYHTLSDFRTAHTEALDGLLTDSVAALMAVDAVTLKRVAQDGMRVRSVAGAASFRRGESLERCLEAAHTQVQTLKAQREEDPGAVMRRQQAARERVSGP